MSRGDFPSAKAPQFPLRFPDGMREALSDLAKKNGRSMNSELILALEAHLTASGVELPDKPQPYNARLDTFVAAALSGLLANSAVNCDFDLAISIGNHMLKRLDAGSNAELRP